MEKKDKQEMTIVWGEDGFGPQHHITYQLVKFFVERKKLVLKSEQEALYKILECEEKIELHKEEIQELLKGIPSQIREAITKVLNERAELGEEEYLQENNNIYWDTSTYAPTKDPDFYAAIKIIKDQPEEKAKEYRKIFFRIQRQKGEIKEIMKEIKSHFEKMRPEIKEKTQHILSKEI